MAKKVKIEVDIESKDMDETGGKFTRLQLQIRAVNVELQKAAELGDTVKFNQLKGQLDELNDQLEKVSFQSKEFHDQLATVPGPAGKVGQAVQGLDAGFKMLLANPIIAVIAGIAGVLMLMYKALNSTAEGQATLNKLTSAFDKILSPLLALVEKIAIPVFEGFAFVLSKVASGIEAAAKFLGVSSGKIKEVYGNINEQQKKANEDEKKKLEEAQKLRDEKKKEQIEKEKQKVAELKKIKEEELKTITEGQEEAMKTLLADRDKEEYEVNQKYVKLIWLATKHKQDTTLIKEAQRKELEAIDKKYNQKEIDEAERAEKARQYIIDMDVKFQQDANAAIQKTKDDAYDKNIKSLDREVNYQSQRNEGLIVGTKAYFEGLNALLNAQQARELADKELTEKEKTAIEEKYIKKREELKKQEQQANAMAVAATLDALASMGNAIASSYDEEAKTSKAAFEKRKKLQIATAIMSAASGMIQILAQPSTLPSPWDWITKGLNAGALAITTGIQIGKIKRTQFEGGGDGGGSTASIPSVSNIGQNIMPAPQIGGSVTNPSAQLAQIASNTSQQNQQPVKAYVLQSDVKTADQFNRRVLQASKLG
jgi:hypothetical protein